MIKFVKPIVVECGKSEDVIKGSCSIGHEGGLNFNKTGYAWRNQRKFFPAHHQPARCEVQRVCVKTVKHGC